MVRSVIKKSLAIALRSALAPAAAAVRIIDGDIISVDGKDVRLRSKAGPIDAPELRKAMCPLEFFRAEAALTARDLALSSDEHV